MDNYVRDYKDVTSEVTFTSAFSSLMRKVYMWMACALAASGLSAYYVATSPVLLNAIFGNKILFFVLLIGEIGLVVGLTAAIRKLSFPVAALMFLVYSIINGVVLSSIFLTYTMSSIATAFFATAATFVAMALIGSFTKMDLTRVGSFAMMGLVGVILGSLINLFFSNPIVDFIITIASILTFVGLTAYDSQKIKEMFADASDVNAEKQKIAVIGALTLYLDFINLFLQLLRLLGRSRN